MLSIEMFPAAQGDCLWVEYGDQRRPNRVLIDGGTAPTYSALRDRVDRLHPDDRRFDLLIITHVDADHIEGVVRLLGDADLGVTFDDVWFNGWTHLPAPPEDKLGPVQGEFLTALISKRKEPWNRAFSGGPVVVSEGGSLPQAILTGGMKITLLSPTQNELAKLRPAWNKVVRAAGLEPGVAKDALAQLAKVKKPQPDVLGKPGLDVVAIAARQFQPDTALANGSSIAILAEVDGKGLLLAGDAFAPVLAASVERLVEERQIDRLSLAAFKVPHHGSKANINVELLGLVRCKRYLFSTNGKIFNHPDVECVARVITHGGKKRDLHFNYRTEDNEIWDDQELMDKYGYSVVYPEDGSAGLRVSV